MMNTKISKQRAKEITIMVWEYLAKNGNDKMTDAIFQLIHEQKIGAEEGQCFYYESTNLFWCLDNVDEELQTSCQFCLLNDFKNSECWCDPSSIYSLWCKSNNIKLRKKYAKKVLKQIKNWEVKSNKE